MRASVIHLKIKKNLREENGFNKEKVGPQPTRQTSRTRQRR